MFELFEEVLESYLATYHRLGRETLQRAIEPSGNNLATSIRERIGVAAEKSAATKWHGFAPHQCAALTIEGAERCSLSYEVTGCAAGCVIDDVVDDERRSPCPTPNLCRPNYAAVHWIDGANATTVGRSDVKQAIDKCRRRFHP